MYNKNITKKKYKRERKEKNVCKVAIYVVFSFLSQFYIFFFLSFSKVN